MKKLLFALLSLSLIVAVPACCKKEKKAPKKEVKTVKVQKLQPVDTPTEKPEFETPGRAYGYEK